LNQSGSYLLVIYPCSAGFKREEVFYA
jgi:hypothetical protein